jgi:hypothetical protein
MCFILQKGAPSIKENTEIGVNVEPLIPKIPVYGACYFTNRNERNKIFPKFGLGSSDFDTTLKW